MTISMNNNKNNENRTTQIYTYTEYITAINGTLISRYGRLLLVSQGLLVVITEWSRPSIEHHIDSFITVISNLVCSPKLNFNAFSLPQMFVYKGRVEKLALYSPYTLKLHFNIIFP
jgi:hypothetical protein